MEDIDKKAAFHQLRLSPVGHQVDREILHQVPGRQRDITGYY